MARNLCKNIKGMTLVEVVVSVILIGIVVGSLGAVVSQSSVFSERIDILYTASYLAQRRIDMLKRVDFDQLSAAEETDIRIDADGNINPNGYYLRTTEVVTGFDNNPYLVKIKVTVKKIKVNMDGSILDSEGKMTFLGQPIIMETLFSNVD